MKPVATVCSANKPMSLVLRKKNKVKYNKGYEFVPIIQNAFLLVSF